MFSCQNLHCFPHWCKCKAAKTNHFCWDHQTASEVSDPALYWSACLFLLLCWYSYNFEIHENINSTNLLSNFSNLKQGTTTMYLQNKRTCFCLITGTYFNLILIYTPCTSAEIYWVILKVESLCKKPNIFFKRDSWKYRIWCLQWRSHYAKPML